MFKKTCLFTTSLTLATAVALPAVAQDDYEDEIIVTATKRQSTLQEVPVAVSVTTADVIEKAKIQDIIDLQTVVPSLRVTQLQNSAQTNFIIRGFGNGANNAGIEPSVGVFIDGVYRSRSAGALGDLPNLERVEVLRGPQSTLFGKNASAGVISVVTAKPSFDTEGYVEGGIGNYNQRTLKGYITTGLDENEAVAVSLGGSVSKRDGYYDNLVTGVAQNDRDRWGLRGQALIEPSDSLSFRVIADIDKLDEVCCGVGNIVAGPTADIITGGGSLIDLNNALTLLGAPASSLLTTEQLGGLGQSLVPNDLYAYEGYYDFDPVNELENRGISLDVEYDINDDMKFKSITSYRTQDIFFDGDVDYTGARLVSQNVQNTDTKSFSQELRIEASSGDLDWMVGAFYFEDDLVTNTDIRYGEDFRDFGDYNVWLLQALPFVNDPANSGAPGEFGSILGLLEFVRLLQTGTNPEFFAAGQGLEVGFNQDNEALSLFGQADLQVTDRLTLTGGLAYTEDRKTVTSFSNQTDTFSDETLFGPFNALAPLQFLPPFPDFPNDVEGNKTRDNQFTYTLRAAYEVSDDINVYGSVATGFKATTWNLSRDSRPTGEITDSRSDCFRVWGGENAGRNESCGTRFAGPEESTVYELGLKAKLDRGYVNVTLFDQTIEGFQSNVFTGTGFNLANAGKQSAQGIEIETFYRPVEGLSLSASATIMDPVYDSFEGAAGPGGTSIDLSGERPAGIHEISAVLSAGYDFNLGDREAYVRGDFLFESEVRVADNVTPEEVGDDAFREVKTFNASAGIDITDSVGLQLWARNLFNDEYPLSIFRSVAQEGSFSGYPNAPRTFGGSIKVNFD